MVEQHAERGTVKLYRPVELRDETRLPGEREATQKGNMWRAIRTNRRFTALDVAAWSNVGGITVTVSQAQAYCRQLFENGVLKLASRRPSKRSGQAYVLVKDLGPLPPEMRRVTALYDPNSHRFLHDDGEFGA